MKLENGKEYTLKYTYQFCHRITKNGSTDFSATMGARDTIKAVFIGTVKTDLGLRNVFISFTAQDLNYIMFNAEKIDYIVKHKKDG